MGYYFTLTTNTNFKPDELTQYLSNTGVLGALIPTRAISHTSTSISIVANLQ